MEDNQFRQAFVHESDNLINGDIDAWDDTEILQVFDEAIKSHKNTRKIQKLHQQNIQTAEVNSAGTDESDLHNLLLKGERELEKMEKKRMSKGGVGVPGPWTPVTPAVTFAGVTVLGTGAGAVEDHHVRFLDFGGAVAQSTTSAASTAVHAKLQAGDAIDFDQHACLKPPTPPITLRKKLTSALHAQTHDEVPDNAVYSAPVRQEDIASISALHAPVTQHTPSTSKSMGMNSSMGMAPSIPHVHMQPPIVSGIPPPSMSAFEAGHGDEEGEEDIESCAALSLPMQEAEQAEQAALSELLWAWYQSGYAAAKYQMLVESNKKRFYKRR